jgi:hypothetical protein
VCSLAANSVDIEVEGLNRNAGFLCQLRYPLILGIVHAAGVTVTDKLSASLSNQ